MSDTKKPNDKIANVILVAILLGSGAIVCPRTLDLLGKITNSVNYEVQTNVDKNNIINISDKLYNKLDSVYETMENSGEEALVSRLQEYLKAEIDVFHNKKKEVNFSASNDDRLPLVSELLKAAEFCRDKDDIEGYTLFYSVATSLYGRYLQDDAQKASVVNGVKNALADNGTGQPMADYLGYVLNPQAMPGFPAL